MNDPTVLAYLAPTPIINSDHENVHRFARQVTDGSRSIAQSAVRIFYAVRDGWRYDPYVIHLAPEDLAASHILPRRIGNCLDKAILMTAMLRAVNIPARIHLSKVRNHIATERVQKILGIEELAPHAYVSLWSEGKWVKVTPAFNQDLCLQLGVDPLSFDGVSDSLLQAFDKHGNAFIEYVKEYGAFAEVPVDLIRKILAEHYPEIFQDPDQMQFNLRDLFS